MQQYCLCCQNQLPWFWSGENTSGEVWHYSESPLRAANELSCGENSSSRSSCLTEGSYCSQVWIPVPRPFRGLPAIPGRLGAQFTSGEREWVGTDPSYKLCKPVLIILHELYQVPVPSARGVITGVYCQSSGCSWGWPWKEECAQSPGLG